MPEVNAIFTLVVESFLDYFGVFGMTSGGYYLPVGPEKSPFSECVGVDVVTV